MNSTKLPDDFQYLPEMYADNYYPNFLVNKLKDALQETVHFIENGAYTSAGIQESFDKTVTKINKLGEEFEENDSELETVARESIAFTIENILNYFDIDMSVEDAIRERDW